MYLRHDEDWGPAPAVSAVSLRLEGTDFRRGQWWFGWALLAALLFAAWLLLAPSAPVPNAVVPTLTDAAQEEVPLALGDTSGGRMAASPERPSIDTAVMLGSGDTLPQALQRAGVGRDEAGRVADLVAGAAPLDQLKPGTTLSLTLGRRPSAVQPRPVERLTLRPAIDLQLTVTRSGDSLALERHPIALDRTPLHIRGLVGQGLYRSMGAAGAPTRLIDAYLKAIAPHVAIGTLGSTDTFDLVADQLRAATGEVEVGALQYAGLDRGGRVVQLVRLGESGGSDAGQPEFWDASQPGAVVRAGAFARPVLGHVTSSFGWRLHPLLGYTRFHKGLDIGAPYGSPVVAVADATVAFAGRSGGYGNFIRLAHRGALGTGYGHLSRIVVSAGEQVRQGQVIGFVGSTGLSTGPHLHWEVWRNGESVNPARLSLATASSLSPETMRALRAKLARLLTVPAR